MKYVQIKERLSSYTNNKELVQNDETTAGSTQEPDALSAPAAMAASAQSQAGELSPMVMEDQITAETQPSPNQVSLMTAQPTVKSAIIEDVNQNQQDPIRVNGVPTYLQNSAFSSFAIATQASQVGDHPTKAGVSLALQTKGTPIAATVLSSAVIFPQISVSTKVDNADNGKGYAMGGVGMPLLQSTPTSIQVPPHGTRIPTQQPQGSGAHQTLPSPPETSGESVKLPAPFKTVGASDVATHVLYDFIETTLMISPSINAKLIQGSLAAPIVVETANPPGRESKQPIQDMVGHENDRRLQGIDFADGVLAPAN
jgi:hypothetical protein